ncbi:MAG: V-type ATP synthase subunit I [Patescibacteria group bacterium]
MAVNLVTKINLISLNQYKDKIIDLLHENGVVQILAAEESKETSSSDFEYDLAQVKFALKFLKKYENKKSISEKFQGDAVSISETKLQKTISEFEYKKIIEEISDLEATINKAQNNISKYQSEIEALTIWKGLNLIPQDLGETKFTHSSVGSIDKENFEILLNKIKQFEKETDITKVNADDKKQYFALVCEKNIYPKIKKNLTELGYEEAIIPYPNRTPKTALANLRENISTSEEEIKKTEKTIKNYTKHTSNLKIIFDYLTWQLEKDAAKNTLAETKESFSLLAWIEKEQLKPLGEKINKITKQYTFEEIPIKEDESVPVPLKNKELISPFEMVTGIYGMPLSKEPDPTPYLAGFFTIFFGMCLTDAGYGLVLAALSFAAIKIFKIPKEKSKLFKVLIWGGLSTFVIGALFGGWFGIIIDEQLPANISNVLTSIRIIDPIKDPITVLIITLIMGIIQVLVGIGVSLYWKIKNNKVIDGILEDGTWIYFILTIMFWISTKVGVLSESWAWSVYLVYSGVALLILSQGHKEKKIYMKIFKGVGSLYGIVGYFSDVLSYSRLLALGLATGIIAMVVNMIGLLVIDMVPYVGYILAIFIFIGGHIFNMVINVLGAFIHSSRLQFVEFFGKFMEGGGARFKPFRKEAKFINIIK